MASDRAALLQERQQARMNKELRRAVDETNIQLAQAQHAQSVPHTHTQACVYIYMYVICVNEHMVSFIQLNS